MHDVTLAGFNLDSIDRLKSSQGAKLLICAHGQDADLSFLRQTNLFAGVCRRLPGDKGVCALAKRTTEPPPP
ncbi:Hypothetical predicted protein [Cloeon dipterum]|uniref:Uncharacterized protein n=1 Tax=Cloeon dipterum TaxID=197152 RepID=A0A8S1CIK5_9INSE|nr:Hypothetical predicted protein [Cloeon dipterum]